MSQHSQRSWVHIESQINLGTNNNSTTSSQCNSNKRHVTWKRQPNKKRSNFCIGWEHSKFQRHRTWRTKTRLALEVDGECQKSNDGSWNLWILLDIITEEEEAEITSAHDKAPTKSRWRKIQLSKPQSENSKGTVNTYSRRNRTQYVNCATEKRKCQMIKPSRRRKIQYNKTKSRSKKWKVDT